MEYVINKKSLSKLSKHFICAVKPNLTKGEWKIFDVNFSGSSVPTSSEKIRVFVKLVGYNMYEYGYSGCYSEPEIICTETEFNDLLVKYHLNNNVLSKWDYKFVAVPEIHCYGMNVLPSYINKECFIKDCKSRDADFAQYGCD